MRFEVLIKKVLQGDNLSAREAAFALEAMMDPFISPVKLAAFLTALTSKGETSEEILGFINAMRKHMHNVTVSTQTIDVCGTGGDGKGLFNISTVVAIVTAACGVPVAKHGNRAASSMSGSADVLEALGVNISLTPQQAEKVLQKVGLVFLFAPLFHPSMKLVGQVRRELGFPTIFNLLGPFTNPASVNRQVVGVPTKKIALKLLPVVKSLSYASLAIVVSRDGLDEASISELTDVFLLRNRRTQRIIINPRSLGLYHTFPTSLRVNNAQESAAIISEVLLGKTGPARDIIVLNTALALVVSMKVKTLRQGVTLAQNALDSGAAQKVLDALREETHRYAR
ncbi:MAG TPA: anthranilate phosphoribosyltransferase [Patescibacteria group bacterium]|nr:anthranilate phosphoribosyltransferase [Patescibacteria group bacterium]